MHPLQVLPFSPGGVAPAPQLRLCPFPGCSPASGEGAGVPGMPFRGSQPHLRWAGPTSCIRRRPGQLPALPASASSWAMKAYGKPGVVLQLRPESYPDPGNFYMLWVWPKQKKTESIFLQSGYLLWKFICNFFS